MKALKVTISGAYRNSKLETVDYENVVGYIPFVADDLASYHVQSRYAHKWIKDAVDKKGEKRYPERVESLRLTWVDKLETVDYDFSFLGKDIKEMDQNELQDLATLKDLRVIPCPKEVSGASLRDMRAIAYAQFSDTFFKTDLMKQKDKAGFNFFDLPPLMVEDENARRDNSGKLSNDEVIALEQKKMDYKSTPKANMTLDDLRKIADEKNIPYSATTGFDDLYSKLFGSGV